eukprot:15433255-Alexandrium_andersonii.AAC.1
MDVCSGLASNCIVFPRGTMIPLLCSCSGGALVLVGHIPWRVPQQALHRAVTQSLGTAHVCIATVMTIAACFRRAR